VKVAATKCLAGTSKLLVNFQCSHTCILDNSIPNYFHYF